MRLTRYGGDGEESGWSGGPREEACTRTRDDEIRENSSV